MNEIELKDLCGEHLLSGVDRGAEKISGYDESETLNFTLDGKTYTACEDPNDGYRSSMRYLRVSAQPTTNNFSPVKVTGRMKTDSCDVDDVLQLVDSATGKIVLEVGTANIDDYYPYWVAKFSPENMACNQVPVASATPKLDYLREQVNALKVLLDDPQPGMSTWHQAYGERMTALADFWNKSA